MGPQVTVHALALAVRRANAAGVVRLTCAPEGLEIELLRVTGFSLGFAPGGVADPVGFRVPYTAVRGLVREGRMLYLTLDPAVVSPYTRFALARFADEHGEVLARAPEVRARTRWASLILPLPLGALAAALVPEGLVGGALGLVSAGALVALAAWALLREVVAWLTWGGPRSDRLRDRFEAALAERLALAPAPGAAAPVHAVRLSAARPPTPRITPAPVLPSYVPAEPAAPPERLTKPLLAAFAAALGVLLVVGFLRRYAAEKPAPPAVDPVASGLAAAARAASRGSRPTAEPERCLCQRADSPLWKDGIPVLSVLTFEGDEGALGEATARPDRAGWPQFAFDLAVVNNGARALHDVRVTLTFARRTQAGRRVGAVDRGLFWGGVLAPGHAVKWRVAAPGSEMSVDASVTGTLAEANLDPAPPDAFFELGASRFRAVRLHGAAMLAYLRDPRAQALGRAIAVAGVGDADLLGRIRRAAAPVFACDVRREVARLEACVFNGASQPKAGLSLREVAPEPRSVPIELTIPVHDGLRLGFDIPPDLGDEVGVLDPSVAD